MSKSSARDTVVADRRHIALSIPAMRVVLVGALIWTAPYQDVFRIKLNEHSPHIGFALGRATHVGPADIIFLLIIVAVVPLVLGRQWSRPVGIGLMGVAGLAAVAVLTLLFSPTLEGLILVLRIVGTASTVLAISNMARADWTLSVIWSTALTALIQGGLALIQILVWNGGLLRNPDRGAWPAAYGAFNGPYTMAAFLVLAVGVMLSIGAVRRIPMTIWLSATVASAAIATTYGRTGALALILMTMIYLAWFILRRRHRLGLAAAAIAIPFGTVAIILQSAWIPRVIDTVQLNSSSRVALMDRAFDVIAYRPILGVGPAGYAPALARLGLTDIDHALVHNVPLLVAAEFGVIAGIVFLAWLGLLGVTSLRTSAYGAALFAAVLPFLMLDNLNWLFAGGWVILAVWLALLDRLRHEARTDQSDPADSDVVADLGSLTETSRID